MGYRIVVAGATGNVGREVVNILAERAFPADEVAVLASSRSQGIEIEYGDTDKMLKIQNIENFDWSGWDIAIFAIGSDATKKYAPIAAAAGCVVIDNSSLFRMDPDVPLIVPEVNPDAIDIYKRKNIIANPNCSTAQLVVALKPLHDYASRCLGRAKRAWMSCSNRAATSLSVTALMPKNSPSKSRLTSFRISIASSTTAIRRKSGR